MKQDEKYLHEHHRQRMRDKYLAAKDTLPDHEILELLLFNVIPRKNTNPIAHRLCRRFGSLRGVLEADMQELMKVDGVGESTAFFLTQLPYLWKRCEMNEKAEGVLLDTVSKIGEYLASIFRGETVEVVYLLMLDNRARLIGCERLFEGTVTACETDARRIAEIALSNRAPRIVLAHNHPGGTAEPSDSDVSTTRYLRRVFSGIDLILEEHFTL